MWQPITPLVSSHILLQAMKKKLLAKTYYFYIVVGEKKPRKKFKVRNKKKGIISVIKMLVISEL